MEERFMWTREENRQTATPRDLPALVQTWQAMSAATPPEHTDMAGHVPTSCEK